MLNAGEPMPFQAEGAAVTLVEGSTFCLSGRDGDVAPGGVQGLYLRDSRTLSRWELRLDSYQLEPLSVQTCEVFTARFVLRRPPMPGLADSTLLLVRERLVGDGLRETITLENLRLDGLRATLTLYVDADFADLFAVKEGRASSSGAAAMAVEHDETGRHDQLVLAARDDGNRRMRVSGSGDPLVTPGALSWRVDIPPRGKWIVEVVAEPEVAGQRITPPFRRGEQIESTAPARKLHAWRAASAAISAEDPALAHVLRRTETDLGALQIHEGPGKRPFVAAGAPWFMTLFGRDSLLTAWMVLPLDADLAVGTLQTLASLQGRKIDAATEEEPGRILHELRTGPDRDRILGGGCYYGSVDATPLFVMLLDECWRWGVDESVVRDLLPAADDAMTWLFEYGDRDGDGFVEYQRSSSRGLENQGWKDSFDAVNHIDGRLAEAPIALCEVQAYVYAAMRARADLAETLEGDAAAAASWRKRADRFRQRFHEKFWLPARGWYAMALDGRKRPVESLSSNVAHCLWTGIATDECAAALIDRLGTDEMDSGYGLRTLSAAMGGYNPMSYHNGSVWPHDTAIAVSGLLRYGHLPGAVPLAHRLAGGLLDAATAFDGRLPELFCGFPRRQFSAPVPYPTSCSPQAWASAAPLLLVRAALGLAPHVPRRILGLRPRLPESWGAVTLTDLRLGQAIVRLEARGDHAWAHGLPDGWTYIPQQRMPSLTIVGGAPGAGQG